MNRWRDGNNGVLGRLRHALCLKNATHLLVFGLLLANVASMIWYVFYGYKASFHSDSAAKVLIAREIVETGDYFLDDEVAKSALQTAFAALRPDGRLITLNPCFAKDQNPVARFLISQDRGQNVRDLVHISDREFA